MRKILVYLLSLGLLSSLFIGCSPKEKEVFDVHTLNTANSISLEECQQIINEIPSGVELTPNQFYCTITSDKTMYLIATGNYVLKDSKTIETYYPEFTPPEEIDNYFFKGMCVSAPKESSVKVLNGEDYEGKEGIPVAGNVFENPYADPDGENVESIQLIYGLKESTALNALPYLSITLTKINENNPPLQNNDEFVYLPSEKVGETGSTIPMVRFSIERWNVQINGASEQDGKVVLFPSDEEMAKRFISDNNLSIVLREIYD